jgi:ribosomal protein S18 acetylase RimI-like enzyme
LRSLRNSNIIMIALDWAKVIWSNQIITDMYFSACLINLIVDQKYRKLWIGSMIIQKTLSKLVELKIKNIDLIADPWSPWLVGFYTKHGFEVWWKNWTHMHFNK